MSASDAGYDDACYVRNYESSTTIIIALIHAWLGIYGCVAPGLFLVIIHVNLACAPRRMPPCAPPAPGPLRGRPNATLRRVGPAF